MNVNKDVILGRISSPVNRNFSTFYSSVGMKLGKEENKINFIIEVMLPSLLLSKNNFYFIDVDYIEGFRLSVQLPLNNNK